MKSDSIIGARIFYALVAALTVYVAFWGLFFPAGAGLTAAFLPGGFDEALPFRAKVPPLHARFIGALYLAATVGCVRNIFAHGWREARLATWMILLWTGGLLVVSLLNLENFAWERTSVWFWFASYVGFPVAAAFFLKQRGASPQGSVSVPAWIRTGLKLQGAVLAMVGAGMLIAPGNAAAFWPWKIGEFLAQIYSAPFLTFGITSFMARRYSSAERWVLHWCLVVAGLGAIAASWMHLDKFNFQTPSAWVWFLSLGGMSVLNGAMLWQRDGR